MATRITAKVRCNLKQDYGTGDHATTSLGFMPDHQDPANAEWAYYTPHLDLRMTVRGEIGRHFKPGAAYTLTFERG